MAHRHRASPWLLATFEATGTESLVPQEVLAQLRADARMRTFESLGQAGALLEIGQAFESAGIPSIVMKGPVVAQRFYPQAALRPYSDIDLLVPYEQLSNVEGICRRFGYEPYQGQGGPGSEHEGTAEVAYETLFINNQTGAKLDVHYDYLQLGLQPRDASGFWQRSENWSFQGTSLRCPRLSDHFLMLAVHVHRHGFERLIWLKDLDLILRQEGAALDWQWLIKEATAEGTLFSIRLTLSMLKSLLDTPLPPEATRLSKGLAVAIGRFIWHESVIFETERRLHPWRRAVQFIPQEGIRGALPSLLFMGRRPEKVHSLALRSLRSLVGSRESHAHISLRRPGHESMEGITAEDSRDIPLHR